MATLHRPSTVASAGMMLVPLLFLGLLETTWMLPDHHPPSTSPPTGGSGVQALWNAGRGAGEYKRTTEGGVMSGRQQHLHGSEQETGQATRMRTDESSRKKEVEDVVDKDDGWNVTVPDVTKKYSKGRLKHKAEKVRTDGDQRDETTTIMTHHETQNLGWFLDTVAVNVTTVPVVTWLHHRAQGDIRSSDQRNMDSDQGNTHIPTPTRPESRGTVLTIEFRVEEHHLMLDLHPTRNLLAATYKEPEKEGLVTVCEYQGKVRGVTGSWAALSVCDGVRGVVVGGNQELLVKPVEGASTHKEPHRVFSASLLQDPPGACGVTESSLNQTSDGPDVSSSSRSGRRRRLATASLRGRRGAALRGGRLWTLGTTRFVELVLVADHSYYLKHGDGTRARCRAIVNIVNAIYRPLGMVVVLSHLEVWRRRDQVLVLPDYKQTLENLRPYRQKLLKERPDLPHDNTVLLTVEDFEGKTVGYATVSGMCSDRDSVAVIQDKDDEVGVVSQTVVHEMGHNLGMYHDSQDNDKCQCDTRTCLMSATGSPTYRPDIGWSSCSKQDLVAGFESNNFDCLKNVPTESFPGSSCGDGVVDREAGEQCDCGPAEYCDNPCCLASTCRLAANASCASGSCCNTETCQIEPGGVECRAPRVSCDLPEYCTGESEYCPDDVYKRDGTSCREGKGHCYRGECGSHEGRCQEVWGEWATAGDPRCFTRSNSRGDSEGNCGFANTKGPTLLPCNARDSPCGTLHCMKLQATPPKLIGDYSYRTHYFYKAPCSYILANTNISSSFWLSPDGAACTENKMCVNQRCVEVLPPAGDCRDGCSGRGVCNSLGHCHCDAGYAPPDCSSFGLGGSVDSGPMRRPRNVHPVLDALFFLFMVLLAIAVLVCCLWHRLRGWWERKGRTSTLPCCVACLDACCCPLMTKVTSWMVTVDPPDKQENGRGKIGQEKETDKMLSQMDEDFKDSPPHTISSDFGHQKSSVELSRPTYFQSISADSGCDVDFEECVTKEPLTSQMSMASLISTFNRFDFRSSRKASERNSRRSKPSGSKKSVPLSRFVVDPLAGNRSSRQGTPPPDHMRAAFRRSITVDATPSARGRPGRVPPLPPTAPKPCKSDSNLQSAPELENTHKVHFKERIKDSSNSSCKKSVQSNNYSQDPSDAIKESANQPTKKPMIPFQNPLSRPKVLPPGDKPPPPPIKESKKNHTTGPRKTNIPPQQDKSVAEGQTTAPKSKRQTHSLKASQATPANTQPQGGRDATGSTKASALSGAAPKKKTVKHLAQKFEAGY